MERHRSSYWSDLRQTFTRGMYGALAFAPLAAAYALFGRGSRPLLWLTIGIGVVTTRGVPVLLELRDRRRAESALDRFRERMRLVGTVQIGTFTLPSGHGEQIFEVLRGGLITGVATDATAPGLIIRASFLYSDGAIATIEQTPPLSTSSDVRGRAGFSGDRELLGATG